MVDSEIPHIVGYEEKHNTRYGQSEEIGYFCSRKSRFLEILRYAFGEKLQDFDPKHIFVATWEIRAVNHNFIAFIIL